MLCLSLPVQIQKNTCNIENLHFLSFCCILIHILFLLDILVGIHHHYTKTLLLLFLSFFTLIGRVIFASNEWTNLSLGINNTIAQLVYTPAYSSWFFTSGDVHAQITWSSNITWILEYTLTGNWHYIFSYLRGTGPYDSWMSYWPTNLWNNLTLIDDIVWIDKTFPIFNIIFNQNGQATIYFSDNNPWVTATLNNMYYVSNTIIVTWWDYIFHITDIAGNSISFNFSLFPSEPEQQPPLPGWWWWGQILHKDSCPNGDFSSSYYDNSCIAEYTTWHTSPYTWWNILWFSQEFINAYLWAHAYRITTMPTIQQAEMTWFILRKHLAKMISTFAIPFVWSVPDTTKTCIFSDMTGETQEMKSFAILSCQLGLMGLNEDGTTPKKTFEPNQLVNRAQFGTVLSRLLFGDTYNIHPGEKTLLTTIKNNIQSLISSIGHALGSQNIPHQELLRYSKHIQALKDHDIMRQIDTPMMLELRWYVMLMLMRADTKHTSIFAK